MSNHCNWWVVPGSRAESAHGFLAPESGWTDLLCARVREFLGMFPVDWLLFDWFVYGGLGAIYGGDVFGPAYANGGDVFVHRMGMRFVWGGLFGWGHFEPLLKKENKALLGYFTGICRVRAEYARFFCRGEFLRPPEVTLADGTPCTNPLKGPVLAAQWSDPDAPGQAAVFLVNVTRRRQSVRVRREGAGAATTLAPLEARAAMTGLA